MDAGIPKKIEKFTDLDAANRRYPKSHHPNYLCIAWDFFEVTGGGIKKPSKKINNADWKTSIKTNP